jgi:uncharacterized protein YdeI (YjbR/CyaY-like superfamily)
MTTLKRATNPMPADVREAIDKLGLMGQYDARPPYQRNDYLGWISRAKRRETRQKRLNKMLDELADGDRYMNMRWRPRAGC